MANVGDTIEIIYMEGEPQMSGKKGVITNIYTDPWGDTRYDGTWGIGLYPGQDQFKVINSSN